MQHIAVAVGLDLPGLDAPHHAPPAPHVRDRRRAEQWHRAAWRLTGHRLEQASTPAEVAEVERDHAAEIDRGPAFAKMHPGAVEDTPAACVDRNALTRVLSWFSLLEVELHRRDLAWARHAGCRIRRTISRCARPVLAALVGLARKHKQVFPSLERIARLAHVSRRTVSTVLDELEAAGVVARVRRRQWVRTPFGRRAVQATNAYVVTVPTETAAAAAERIDRGGAGPSADQNANDALLFATSRRDRPEPPPAEPRLAQRLGDDEPAAPIPRPSGSVDWRERARASLERMTKGRA